MVGSLEDLRVGLCEVHDHFPEEGVGPCEPLPGYLVGVIDRKGLMHEVVLGRSYQALEAISDLVI